MESTYLVRAAGAVEDFVIVTVQQSKMGGIDNKEDNNGWVLNADRKSEIEIDQTHPRVGAS